MPSREGFRVTVCVMARPKKDPADVAETVSIRMTPRDLATLDALVEVVNAEAGALGASATRASLVVALVRREASARGVGPKPTPPAAPAPKAPKPSPKASPKPTPPAPKASTKGAGKGKPTKARRK